MRIIPWTHHKPKLGPVHLVPGSQVNLEIRMARRPERTANSNSSHQA